MTNRWIVLAAFVAGGMWMAGCGGSEATETESTGGEVAQTSGGELVPPGEAGVGDRTRCPVSGEEFVVTAESPHVEYQGKTYYFCCEHCPARFQANPEQFVHPEGGAATEAPATPEPAAAPPAT